MSVFWRPWIRKTVDWWTEKNINSNLKTEITTKIATYKNLNDAIIDLQPISDIFDKWVINLDSALSSILWNLGDIWLTAWLWLYYRNILKKHNLWHIFNDDVWLKLLKDYGIKYIWSKMQKKISDNTKFKAKNWTELWWLIWWATELAMWNIYKAHEQIISRIKEARDYIWDELSLQWIKEKDLEKPSILIANIKDDLWNFDLKSLPKNHRMWINDLPKATKENIKQILSI